jgi:hypothetical protein
MSTQKIIDILKQDPCMDSVELQESGDIGFWLTGPTGCDEDGNDVDDFDYDTLHNLSQSTIMKLNELLGEDGYDINTNDCPGYYNESLLTIK